MFAKSFIVLGIFSLLLSFNTFARKAIEDQAGDDTILYVECNGTYYPCANNPNIDGVRYCPKDDADKKDFCAKKGRMR